MDSKLYDIEIKDGNRVIKDILNEHELGLSTAIVEKICYAIENNIKKIDIARLITDKVCITIQCSNKNYKDSLETNMENLIKYESYELCALAKKYLDTIERKDLEL
jgi:hypothetical protein